MGCNCGKKKMNVFSQRQADNLARRQESNTTSTTSTTSEASSQTETVSQDDVELPDLESLGAG